MCKFKKAIAVMLSTVMMLSVGTMPIAVNAATVESSSAVAEKTGTYNDFSYSLTDKKVTITGYTGTETEIEIPSEINGCPVTSIGDFAFRKSLVTNVIIPDTVTHIGDYVFQNSSITNVIIPNTVTYIGKYAFGFSKIVKIVIPDSVTYLGEYAFAECYHLTDITLSNNISCLETGLFTGCYILTKIVIPDSITSIGEKAFYNCDNLEEIVLSDNIEVIPEGSFTYLLNLKKVKLPTNLKTIEAYAFYYCISLSEIEIPDKVTTIGEFAFRNCPELKSITLPKGIQEIGVRSLGYYLVSDPLLRETKVKEFTIYGYKDTVAEKYANDNKFKFEDLVYINAPIGDVDLDDEVTVLDVTLLQRYCTNDAEINSSQINIADVDKNGIVNIADVTAIQRIIVESY